MTRASDTRPKDGDAPKIAAPLASSAVAESDAPKGNQDSTMSHSTAELDPRETAREFRILWKRGGSSLLLLAADSLDAAATRLEHLERGLREIHAARLRNGEDLGYGWSITKLNKAMDAALPLLGLPVPPKLELSADEIEALRALTQSGNE